MKSPLLARSKSMNKQQRNITINIGPQDEMSWFFLSFAIAAAAFFIFAVPHMKGGSDVEIEKVKAEAEIQKAKILAGKK